ncbi:hypothetical protein [Haliscomenobacter sp.]|uniref:hypothetical protein n=1 Tax=Haliscomenobacter sp. TaxID=2717303 RepID=UPI0035940FD5
MKNLILSLVIAAQVCLALTLNGQDELMRGMNYQAVAFDASGKVMANVPIKIKFAFSVKEGPSLPFYTETHQITTDASGLFSLIIGEGAERSGSLSVIPWAEKKIWLDVEMGANGLQSFNTKQSTQLHAVPYAFHANSANQLVENENAPSEKNQSIRWTTTGNTGTKPETHFLGTRDNKNLTIKTNLITRAEITNTGQMIITGGVPSGPDSNPDSYPILIEGSKQGIYIKVNGSRSYDNNFVNFADDFGTWGNIEGQTFAELEEWWQYRFKIAIFALNGAALITTVPAVVAEAVGLYAAGTGAAASLIFAFAAPGFYAAAVAATAKAIVIGVEAASLLAQSIEFGIKSRELIGVSYSSGAGDYAEWLERSPMERDLQFGEIVGVKAGKVSLNTTDVDHIMVVSTRPIVLGNAPQPDQEHLFEKVAFLGQAPVRVRGKVEIGDYILASGNNDGIGIALHPSKVSIADYKKIVGVAWEAAKENPINLVNIGIGLNKNDLAPKVEDISAKVDNIIAYLEGKGPLRPGSPLTTAPELIPSASATATAQEQMLSNEEFDQIIDSQADYLKGFYRDLEKKIQAEGANIPDLPEIQALFKDPVKTLKKMRRDPALQDQWKLIDQKIKADR